jgi:hypothetical protein
MKMAMLDCHATAAANWRWVNPSVFNKAKSRRRRRTEATSISPRAPTAPTANVELRSVGVTPADL